MTKYPRTRTLNKIAKKYGTAANQIYAWFSAKRATDGCILLKGGKKIPKVPRADLTTTTTELLEAAFAKNSIPTTKDLKEIREKTNIDESRLEAWFNRKRRSTRSLIYNEKLKSEKHHLIAFEEAYQNNKYLLSKELNKLGDRIGATHLRVQGWFQNRRIWDKDFDRNKLGTPFKRRIESGARYVLNEAYKENKNLTKQEMHALADRAGLKQTKVYNWFSTKRSRDKDYKSRVPPFTAAQTQSLQAAYQKNARPSTDEKEKLAKNIDLSLYQVTNWYYGARAKFNCPKIVAPLTTKQKDLLLRAYAQNTHPSSAKFTELANCVGLTESRVRNWFKHIRCPNKPRAANRQAKQEGPDLQDINVKIKMEPMDIGLGDVK